MNLLATHLLKVLWCVIHLTNINIDYFLPRFLLHMDLALQTMLSFGFKDKELDDIKALIMDTNFYLLMVTISVCFIHVSHKSSLIL